ncbi:MAG: carbohydrate ABC transporter permease [Rhodospirillales bacterium]|nr:carbohydrate ABC transporter permease [Rhodospirillales bacterium]
MVAITEQSETKAGINYLKVLRITFVFFIAFVSFIPFLWIMLSAFKVRTDIMSPTLSFFFSPTLSNFVDAFVEGDFGIYLWNSTMVGVGTVILCLVTGVPAAYAFSRFYVLGKKHLYFFVLTTRMAPAIAVALPLYIVFKNLYLLGSIPGVILAHATFTLALVIYLMKGLFDEIPREIDQASLVDGYSEWQTFLYVILPISRSSIAATGFLAFIFSWNEFLFALLLGGTDARTLPAAFPGLVTPLGTYWGQLCAAAFAVAIPVIILATLIQKYLVKGLTLGAVKG